MAGPTKMLLPGNMIAQAQKILEQEFDMEYEKHRVYSLVEITLKDGTVLGPIMLEMKPMHIDMVAELIREGHKVAVLSNDNEAILIPTADIKHIKALRVTSKE